MKIRSLYIKDFRGIAEMTLTFGDSLTVIVGENGIGKTSVLDALAIALDQYVARFVRASVQSARQIKDGDIRIGGLFDITAALLKIETDIVPGVPLGWSLSKQRREGKLQNPVSSYLEDLNQYVRQRVEAGRVSLAGEPLIVYYGQRRAVLDMPQRLRENADLDPTAGFHGALDGNLNFREFVAWFCDRTLLEFQEGRGIPEYRDHQLEAVRRAMTNSTDLVDPEYRMVAPRGLCVKKKARRRREFGEGTSVSSPFDVLRVDQLSSGEKIFIALAGDLARRLAVLNPDSDNPLCGEGVVLIDEIELHLHPRWQRKFIPWLTETFPNCQFVVTTHSPQVLGEVEANAIRVLRSSQEGVVRIWTPDATYGRDSNHILLHVLGADERDEYLKEKLDELDDAIANGALDAAGSLLIELREKIEGSPPELTVAQARLERRQRQGQARE